MYKDMKEGRVSWDEFSHSIDEIQFGNLGELYRFSIIPRQTDSKS